MIAATNNYVSQISSGINMAKDVANILFFLVAATIAILSYLQAKKTVFAPIRTETFKVQLKAFEEVLVFFERHPSMNIDDEFDFFRIVNINAIKMLDAYALLFFADKVKKDDLTKRREKDFEDVAGVVISHRYAEKNVEVTTYHLQRSEEKLETPSSPALILASWQAYDHGAVDFTKKFQQSSDRLNKFQVSPLLPKDLKTLIAAFEDQVEKNLYMVGEVLTSTAKQFPEKYPTFEALNRAELFWIWNEYNQKYSRLKDKQNEILKFLESYLQIDNLLSKES